MGFVDPRPYPVWKIQQTYEGNPNIGTVRPTIGYGQKQLRDLEATIEATDATPWRSEHPST